MKKPFRFEFRVCGLVTEEVHTANSIANIEAGWPELEHHEPRDVPLAVVGGGPSISEHLEELKEWKGDIWAINESASFLSHHAPKANVWLFTVDPDEAMAAPQFTAGVQKAILSSGCNPKLLEALRGKDVKMFHCKTIEGMEIMILGGGPCSAARTPMQAAWQGYKSICYYGCEGSLGKTTHAYRNESRPRQMIIRAGGVDYVTTPDLYINTMYLAKEIEEYKFGLTEKSGGLLRAMLKYPDTWEVVALSEALKKMLDPTALPYDPKTYVPLSEAA